MIAETTHNCRSAQVAHGTEVVMPSGDEWGLLKEISDELRIPERTLLYYKDQGDFPDVYRFGKKHRRVKKSDYESWKDQHLEE